MAVRARITITEATDLPEALASLEQSCRKHGGSDANLDRLMAEVAEIAQGYSDRGRQLIGHGSNFKASQTVKRPPFLVTLHCDFVAGKRPLLDRLKMRLRG